MQTMLLLIMAATATDIAPPVFFAGNEELRQYITGSVQANPEIKAKYQEWQALLERVPQVTALDDPMFTYTQFLQSDQRSFGLRLEQRFPWFGTLRLRGDKALAEADAALARFYSTRNQVFAEVKRAYFEYALLGESIKIAQSQTDVLANVEELVKSRYSLGLAAQSDLFRVEIEKDKLEDMKKGLEQSQPSLAARLLAALGKNTAEEVPWPQSVEFPPVLPPDEQVIKRILAANPDITAIQHMVKSWEKGEKLARKKGYPDFSIEIGYDDMKDMKSYESRMNNAAAADAVKMFVQDAPTNGVASTLGNIAYDLGKDFYLRTPNDVRDDVMISLRLSLPVWRNRVRAGITEATLMKESVENDRRRMALALENAAKKVIFVIQDAERRCTLYKESLVTKEWKTYESLLSEYGAGADTEASTVGADFLDIQNSIRSLLEFQLEQARAARDWQVGAADLEMLMGGPWETVPITNASDVPNQAKNDSQKNSASEKHE